VRSLSNDARRSERDAPNLGLTLHNRLPVGHRYRPGLEGALRTALGDLSGPWDVSMYAVGRILIRVDVLAPGGSRWSLAVPVPEGPQAEDVAETVRVACARLRRIEPALSGSEGVGGGTSSPNAPEGHPLLRGAPGTGELSVAQPALQERA
jgi:hypothetical protein